MEPSSPRSDHSAPDEDELLLAREPLVAGKHTRGALLSPRLSALTLVLVAVLVLVAGAAGLQHFRQQPGATVPTLVPATPTSTAALTLAPTIPAGQGWTPAGPPWAQQIVFTPSLPQTAYVCGSPGSRDPTLQTPVVLGVSGDSGQSWRTLNTPFNGSSCQITVNPFNAHDLLLAVGHCVTCAPPTPEQLYRSFDGGHSWHRVQFPPLSDGSTPVFTWYWWAWQGASVFVWPVRSGPQTRAPVAVSVASGPFTWVNETALLARMPASLQLNNIYATLGAVYVDFVSAGPGDCGNSCLVTKVSTDMGATWTFFQPRYHGQPVYLLDQLVSIADGYTLLGQIYPGQNASTRLYLSSSDGGTTWTPLPSPPGNLVMLTVASTPTSILYCETWSPGVATATPAVYRLTPGTRVWVLVGALPNSGVELLVSWDAQGNPLALWGGSSNSPEASGLATHLP